VINCQAALIIFNNADQRGRQRPKRVGYRNPLGHGGHRHIDRHEGTDGRAYSDPDKNPLILDDLAAQEGAHYREQHSDLRQEEAAPGSLWRI